MHRERDGLVLGPTDLANHLACRHLTELDRAVAEGRLEKPTWRDPSLEVLRERGLRHERAYVEYLRASGARVVDLSAKERSTALAATTQALRDGVDVIVQASFRSGSWTGTADVLKRVEEPSGLGHWSYEVLDTKLAQETRGSTVLQLCQYADLLGAVQGRPPESLGVVKPGNGFPVERFRFSEHAAYYRLVRRRIEAALERGGDIDRHYPEPVEHCEVCRWWTRCDRRRRDDDHLSLVAGLGSLHADELRRQGIHTLEAFASRNDPLPAAPVRGQRETYAALHEQAVVQLRGRRTGRPVVELLPVHPDRGLLRLPEPSAGDVFLDFEGDPFVDGGGLEYLLGYAFRRVDGALDYRALWALDRAAERVALETFVDVLLARLDAHPDLHVYHFAPYEPAALKRLASRHATREAELDRLLRGSRFVDLHGVLRQGLRASVESYSLKPLEIFFGYRREVDLREEAAPALRRVAAALELGVLDAVDDDDRHLVQGYNRDDCLSLVDLQAWLEEQRAVLAERHGPLTRPPLGEVAASEAQEERTAGVAAVYERLVADIPSEPMQRDATQRARWLLAHLLDYFHREWRVAWWEYFARRDADAEERQADRKCLVGLRFVEELPQEGRRRVPAHRYRFPPQEASFAPGDVLRDLDAPADADRKVGTVEAFDPRAGTIDVRKTKDTADVHPNAVHIVEDVPIEPVAGALLAFGRSVADLRLAAGGDPFTAARRLLLRIPPCGATPDGGCLALPEEAPLDAAPRLAAALDGDVLAIQGPPGAGKTYVGARVIVALARAGRAVGVTATSHKVIRHLLKEVVKHARAQGMTLRVVHKPSSRGPSPDPVDGVEDVKDSTAFEAAVGQGVVAGAVAWTWARGSLEQRLD
ncbi:MAG: TM0106 family RecB-like putative nuclease, partial [Planctomycetes bacterium]|nr:TM0106 family RecB-like putative nuclease [Planctomycetota bacterium]